MPSEGTCTIGGNLSTNAGGVAAIAHGIARSHALGLEVVLADGRVLNNLNKLKKDNTGYDLKDLFIGSEGTLGVITAAVLRLVPRPRSVETAFVGVPSPQAGVDLLNLAHRAQRRRRHLVRIDGAPGIEAVIKHDASSRDPLAAPHPWYILLELSSQARSGLREVMEDILADGAERGLVEDATIADSLEQAKAFWRIREMFGEVQRQIGASIKHDVSVPVAAVPAFIEEANAAVVKLIPGSRPLPFGHIGDGNIHYNVTQPEGADRDKFLARWDEVNAVVFAVVHEARRLDLGRARRRRDEARHAAAVQGPGGARSDARAQAHARSQRHPQSRQGAVSNAGEAAPAGAGRPCRRRIFSRASLVRTFFPDHIAGDNAGAACAARARCRRSEFPTATAGNSRSPFPRRFRAVEFLGDLVRALQGRKCRRSMRWPRIFRRRTW